MKGSIVYCQNCRAPNSMSDANCSECGTRLLIVVFPPSLQFDTNQTPTFYEDHLLERVSALELRLDQLTDALRRIVNTMQEQSELLIDERNLIKDLYDVIGAPDSSLESEIGDKGEDRASNEFLEIEVDRIAIRTDEVNRGVIRKLLEDGIAQIFDGEEKIGLKQIERACDLNPGEPRLLSLFARLLYGCDKIDRTLDVSKKALSIDPAFKPALILNAVAFAEKREFAAAYSVLDRLRDTDFVELIHYLIDGMDAALSADWNRSVSAFKKAVEYVLDEDLEYLLGSAYYQLGRFAMASNRFESAVIRDPNFSDAWYMLAVSVRDHDRMMIAKRNALATVDRGAQCRSLTARKRWTRPANALAFNHLSRSRNLTFSDGGFRLRNKFHAIVEMALDTITENELESVNS